MKGGSTFSYYYCQKMARQGKTACSSGYVRTDTVDGLFMDQLRKIRLDPGTFLIPERKGTVNDTLALRRQIKELESQIANLTAALGDAMETAAAAYIIQQINSTDRSRKELKSELRKAEIAKGKEKTMEEARAETFGHIEYLLDNFDILEYSVKNGAVRKMLKTCVYDGESLRIVF